MDNEQYSRTIGLLGEETFSSIQKKTIYLAGLGGVGGTAFEALLRMGFKNFVLVDLDEVALSNLNRQVLYKKDNIGQNKVDVAKRYALDIDDSVNIKIYKEDVKNVLPEMNIDFAIDCIDDVNAKIELINHCLKNNIPIVTSMGMANKLDPSFIKIDKLNKSTVDPLAKKMRYELKKREINYSSLMCVYSSEIPLKEGNKLHSLITVTSTAGLYIASYVLSFLKRK